MNAKKVRRRFKRVVALLDSVKVVLGRAVEDSGDAAAVTAVGLVQEVRRDVARLRGALRPKKKAAAAS